MRCLSRKPVEFPVEPDRQETAWTRRRFLGALVASAVAAGVKIPGIPAAEPLVELPHRLYAPPGLDYYLVIHPAWHNALLAGGYVPASLEVAEVGHLTGIRILEAGGLEAALADLRAGKLTTPIATRCRCRLMSWQDRPPAAPLIDDDGVNCSCPGLSGSSAGPGTSARVLRLVSTGNPDGL